MHPHNQSHAQSPVHALAESPANVAKAAAEANPAVYFARAEQHGAIREEFKMNLAAAFLPTMPSAVTDEVFRLAWGAGWSSQYSDRYATVQDHYEEFAYLVSLVEQTATLG